MVTVAPAGSINFDTFGIVGIAVIAFNFSSQSRCPSSR